MTETTNQISSAAEERNEQQREIIERLSVCLRAVASVHGLDRDDLRATERAIRSLSRRSMAPSPNEFWETTAYPRSIRLVEECRRVIDRELGALRELATLDDLDRVDREAARRRLLDSLPSPVAINELGAWWQRRLRRAALLKAIPEVLIAQPRRAELIVANREMLLLDEAPWSHCDRLLSAYELAHGEIGRFGRRRVDDLLGAEIAVPTSTTRSGSSASVASTRP